MKLFRSFGGVRSFLLSSIVFGSLAAAYVVWADGKFKAIQFSIESYFDSYRSLSSSLETVSSDLDGYSPRGKSDREVIKDYYNGLRRSYLVEGLRNQKDAVLSKVKEYADPTSAAISAYVRFVEESQGISNSNWNACLDSSGVTARNRAYVTNAAARLEDVYADVDRELRKDYVIRQGSVYSGDARLSGTQNEMLREVVANLDRDWKTALTGCCEQALGKRDVCSTKADEIFKGVAGQPTSVNLGSVASTVYVPDPFASSSLKSVELAAIIRDDRTLGHEIKRARTTRDTDAELDALSQAEAACARAKEHQQEKAGSDRMMKSLGTSIGKTIKCHVIPFLGTQYLDTEYQRMTTALANVPMQGNQWDVNCDPRETAIYDALRPLDPIAIANRWGINENMSNPPWIAMLRRLQPVQSPFPMVVLPGAGVVTPFGIVGRGLGETENNGRGSSSGGSSANASGGSRGTLIKKKSTTSDSSNNGSRLATRLSTSRGLAQGSESVVGIRRAVSNVAHGKAVAENISGLQSGASKTRALAQSMESNNRKLSADARREKNSKSAATARTFVRGLTGSRASRTSAQRIAQGVAGYRSAGRKQAQANFSGKSLADVEAQNEKERLRLEALAKMYVGNIEIAKKQAESMRQQIFDRILARDQKVGSLMGEILNKPPKTQASKVMNARKELMQIDRELGQLKAQYDVYVGSVMEQASLLRSVIAFGSGNSIGPGNTWDPRLMGGSAPNSVPVDGPQAPNLTLPPALMPQNIPMSAPGFPQVPGAGSLQGQLNQKFRDLFEQWILIPRAFAATQKNLGVFKNELEWSKGFEQFKSDLFDYADAKLEAEKLLLRQASDAYAKQRASVDPDTVQDLDTEVLIGMEIFSDNMSVEVDDLLAASTRSEITLSSEQKLALQNTVKDSRETLDALEKISLQFKDSYPLNDEENPEVWWGMLPEMLIY